MNITEEMIAEAIEYGVNRKDAERGYYISISGYGNGATHIQRIDVMDAFQSDWEAAKKAEADGIPIIRDMLLPEEHTAPYIDTVENRFLLKPLIKEKTETPAHLSYEEVKAKTLGVKNTVEQIERLIRSAPDMEQITLLNTDNGLSIMLQTCDCGYDYSIYDHSGIIDGGQLDDPALTMAQAFFALLDEIEGQSAVLKLIDYDDILDNGIRIFED